MKGRALLWLLAALATGCASSRPVADLARVHCFRGFIGVWSHGMDQLADSVHQHGISAEVHADSDWQRVADTILADTSPRPHPVVLVGHSFGADNAIRVAERMGRANRAVDLLVTIECCNPPPVPRNVRRVVNIFKRRPLDYLPWWRGVPVSLVDPSETQLTQIDIARDRPDLDSPHLGHAEIDKAPGIQRIMLASVLGAVQEQSAKERR